MLQNCGIRFERSGTTSHQHPIEPEFDGQTGLRSRGENWQIDHIHDWLTTVRNHQDRETEPRFTGPTGGARGGFDGGYGRGGFDGGYGRGGYGGGHAAGGAGGGGRQIYISNVCPTVHINIADLPDLCIDLVDFSSPTLLAGRISKISFVKQVNSTPQS